jgi:ribosomal-protein-alanine N-acetyltransferase
VGNGKLTIVPMRAGDIPAVLELEAGTLSAWNMEHLEDELQQPAGFQFVVRDEAAANILAVLCGRIMDDEAEILKLSVAPEARRKGLGYKLLDFVLDYCRAKGVKNCFLELRTSNTAAAKLYEKRGFMRVGSRRDYYDEPVEDAVLMQLAL